MSGGYKTEWKKYVIIMVFIPTMILSTKFIINLISTTTFLLYFVQYVTDIQIYCKCFIFKY